jgi:hypothetical protein
MMILLQASDNNFASTVRFLFAEATGIWFTERDMNRSQWWECYRRKYHGNNLCLSDLSIGRVKHTVVCHFFWLHYVVRYGFLRWVYFSGLITRFISYLQGSTFICIFMKILTICLRR